MRYKHTLIAAGILLSACGTVVDKDPPPVVVVDTPAAPIPAAPGDTPPPPVADHPDTSYIRYHAAGAAEESPEIAEDLLKEKKARLLVKNYTDQEAKDFQFIPDGSGRARLLPRLLVLQYDDQETIIDEGYYKKVICTLNGTSHTVHNNIHIRAGHTYLLKINK